MKFKRTFSSRASIKKLKEYSFNELSEQDISEGKKRTHDNPFFIVRQNTLYGLYTDSQGVFTISMYHSFDNFKEIKVNQTLPFPSEVRT